MKYEPLRHTANRHVVLRSKASKPRLILIPYASLVSAPDRILSIEQDILAQLACANQEIRPSSPHLMIHGVELVSGTSSDYVVVNKYSKTKKAFVHAMAFPELVDKEFAQDLCSVESTINRLILVSESTCIDIALSRVNKDQTEIELTRRFENTGHDFFGCVIDYLRKEFAEGMPIKKRLLNVP